MLIYLCVRSLWEEAQLHSLRRMLVCDSLHPIQHCLCPLICINSKSIWLEPLVPSQLTMREIFTLFGEDFFQCGMIST